MLASFICLLLSLATFGFSVHRINVVGTYENVWGLLVFLSAVAARLAAVSLIIHISPWLLLLVVIFFVGRILQHKREAAEQDKPQS